MRDWLRGTVSIAVALACAGCAATPRGACGAGEQAMVTETLYFGPNIPGGGTVSDADWAAFVAEDVTPRFPDGLTTWSATGQWRGASGAVEQEGSHVLHLLRPDDPARAAAVAEVARAYKARFRQEAVLRERTPACISF
jgi:hypothetical protein